VSEYQPQRCRNAQNDENFRSQIIRNPGAFHTSRETPTGDRQLQLPIEQVHDRCGMPLAPAGSTNTSAVQGIGQALVGVDARGLHFANDRQDIFAAKASAANLFAARPSAPASARFFGLPGFKPASEALFAARAALVRVLINARSFSARAVSRFLIDETERVSTGEAAVDPR
jgi:hypothetical protein